MTYNVDLQHRENDSIRKEKEQEEMIINVVENCVKMKNS